MGFEGLAVKLGGMVIGAVLILTLAYFWGRAKGKQMASEVIQDAFVEAGLAKEKFQVIMANPADAPAGLFDDWVHDKDNNS